MNRVHYSLWLMTLMAGLMGCNGAISEHDDRTDHGNADEVEPAKGSHGGRLLIDGDFALELAIFETGVPPEFRAWSTQAGTPVRPDDVDLHGGYHPVRRDRFDAADSDLIGNRLNDYSIL